MQARQKIYNLQINPYAQLIYTFIQGPSKEKKSANTKIMKNDREHSYGRNCRGKRFLLILNLLKGKLMEIGVLGNMAMSFTYQTQESGLDSR